MRNSYKFFQNKSCKFFPCHKGIKDEDFNCMFCFCPTFNKITNIQLVDGQILVERGCGRKYCEKCTFPHERKNYDKIIKLLKKSDGFCG